MKNLLVSILCIALYVSSYCQDTIDVFEKTVKLAGLSRETEYIGFAEGDRIIINFSVEKGKDLKDITISEYPATVKFAAHTIKSIQNKVLNIPRKGIYIFDYYNSNLSARTISIKIQRIPKSEETKFFNTNIKWVNRVDTSYIAKENTYLVSSDTSFVDIIDSRVRVHSQTNLENPNKTIVDFIIPANTIKWTYWIGVGEEGQEAFKNDYAAFSKTGSKLIGAVNPLVGLAFGLFTMTL